tara:strand:+ start:723 stop:1052 length:330 start_codon:yes stop_codon:yes gene_type:complete
MRHYNIIEKYFKLFSNKDLDGLEDLFHKDITLKDWDINVEGFRDTVQAFHEIFTSVEVIDVTVKDIFGAKDKFTCVIDIDIDNLATLKVVDLITVTSDGLIKSISAFKQ